VGNDDPGSAGKQSVDGMFDIALGGGVEARRRLVEDDQAGIAQEDADKGQELGAWPAESPAPAGPSMVSSPTLVAVL
jgi:hypothetical protein